MRRLQNPAGYQLELSLCASATELPKRCAACGRISAGTGILMKIRLYRLIHVASLDGSHRSRFQKVGVGSVDGNANKPSS